MMASSELADTAILNAIVKENLGCFQRQLEMKAGLKWE